MPGPFSLQWISVHRRCGISSCLVVVLHDQVIDNAVGFVDMVESAIAQTAHGGIILFAGDIVMRLVEQLQRAVKAAGAVHSSINRRMISQILAIINRSALDLSDSFVDLVDGMILFFVHVMGERRILEMSARVPQVGERMQVCRMPSWFVGEGECGAKSNNKREYGAMSYSLHSLLKCHLGRMNFS
jgi:hypothetical protein